MSPPGNGRGGVARDRDARAHGGSGLGITEAAIIMQAVAESGAGFSGASAIHMNILGLHPVVVFGSDEQKQRTALADRRQGTGLLRRHRAGRRARHDATQDAGGAPRRRYVLSGRKIWTSTAQVAEKMLILARTTSVEEAERPSLDELILHRSGPQCRRGTRDPEDGAQGSELESAAYRRPRGAGRRPHRRGRQGLPLHLARDEPGADPDRRGSRCDSVAQHSTVRRYAAERVVFGRPIGQNQAIQHPLAERWIEARRPS